MICCGGKARTLASTEGFIYLFVCGFACVMWSSAKEPEAGDGKENEREPGDEVGGHRGKTHRACLQRHDSGMKTKPFSLLKTSTFVGEESNL